MMFESEGVVFASKEDQVVSSTYGGDSSSESMSSYDDPVSFDLKKKSMTHPTEEVGQGYMSPSQMPSTREPSPMPSSREASPMPATREASPEPLWNNITPSAWIEDLVAHHNQAQYARAPRASSRERPFLLQQAVPAQPPAQPPAMVFFQSEEAHGMNAMFVPTSPVHLAPMSAVPQAYPQPMQFPAPLPCVHRATPLDVPAEQTVPSKSKRARKQKAVTPPSAATETRAAPPTSQGSDFLANISGDKKEALCEYIKDFMTKKGLTSPAGYLIVDVLSNLWRDLFTREDQSIGWQDGKQRFVSLLRSAPKHFEVIDKGLPQGTQRVAIRRDPSAKKGSAPAPVPQSGAAAETAAPAASPAAESPQEQPAAATELAAAEPDAPAAEETAPVATADLSATDEAEADAATSEGADRTDASVEEGSAAAPKKLSWADVVRCGK